MSRLHVKQGEIKKEFAFKGEEQGLSSPIFGDPGADSGDEEKS